MTEAESKQPYHAEELALQERTGRRALAEALAPRIASYMTEEASELFSRLPFVVAGSIDESGRPWASVLCGPEGFMQPAGPRLRISTRHRGGDPITKNLVAETDMALIGIDLVARRRYRVNGRATAAADEITFKVEQCYRNCPQYINGRSAQFNEAPQALEKPRVRRSKTLDEDMLDLVRRADTFFIATHGSGRVSDDPRLGADVSHRGGNPGFVVAEESRLSFPDYVGNFMFNTLGNLARHPFCGLVFVDFVSGTTLQIAGRATADWTVERANDVPGAQRMIDVEVEEALLNEAPLPIAWGDLTPARDLRRYQKAPEAPRDAEVILPTREIPGFQPMVVSRVVEESETVRSIYLRHPDGKALEPLRPGQHLRFYLTVPGEAVPVVRHYSLSHDNPQGSEYRIGVRRVEGERPGVGSNYMHDQVNVGSVLQVSHPRGDFALDVDQAHPVALISAGIGITPMLCMLLACAAASSRSIIFIHGNRHAAEQAYASEVRRLSDRLPNVTAHFRFSQPRAGLDIPGRDFETPGRLDAELLKALVPPDAEAFLCGPGPFMDEMRAALIAQGLPSDRVHFESFGSAIGGALPVLGRDGSRVLFADEGVEAEWHEDCPSLLDLAESAGIDLLYSCRSGDCGSCEQRLLKGEIIYARNPTYEPRADHVLVCCAQPSSDIVIARPQD